MSRPVFGLRGMRYDLGAVIAAACLLAGCGGGGLSTASSTADRAHIVTLADAICREYADIHTRRPRSGRDDLRSEIEQLRAYEQTEFARLRAVVGSAHKLPGFNAYASDLAALGRLRTAMSKLVGKGSEVAIFSKDDDPFHALSYMEESYRLDVKIDDDEQALGLDSCIGPRPRRPISG